MMKALFFLREDPPPQTMMSFLYVKVMRGYVPHGLSHSIYIQQRYTPSASRWSRSKAEKGGSSPRRLKEEDPPPL
jgi:hypothetical protein